MTCEPDKRPADRAGAGRHDDQGDLAAEPQAASNGFFLQVEGASIDKRDHAANPCQQIGETIAFDKAIGARSTGSARTPTR